MCLGVPGRIIDISDSENLTAVVDVGGVQRAVNLACVVHDEPPQALLGSWVLVHVGFAMSRIDEDEAARTLALLRALGELEEGAS